MGVVKHPFLFYMFKIHEQTLFFEQKVWLFGKCSLNLQRSKCMNKNKTVNIYKQLNKYNLQIFIVSHLKFVYKFL